MKKEDKNWINIQVRRDLWQTLKDYAKDEGFRVPKALEVLLEKALKKEKRLEAQR